MAGCLYSVEIWICLPFYAFFLYLIQYTIEPVYSYDAYIFLHLLIRLSAIRRGFSRSNEVTRLFARLVQSISTRFILSTLSILHLYITSTMSLLRTQLRRTALAFRAPAPVPTLARSAYTSVPEPSDPLKGFQPDESTPKAQQQSPNVPTTWSTSQNPKPHAQNNAR